MNINKCASTARLRLGLLKRDKQGGDCLALPKIVKRLISVPRSRSSQNG